MSKQVEVIEVGPRDGFQSVKCTPITTEQKLTVIDQLVAAGVKHIEYTSFVSPKAIPQLADAADVTRVVLEKYPDMDLFALIPNLRGAQNAYELGLRRVCYVVSLSKSHNKANINRTHEQSLEAYKEIRAAYPDLDIIVDLATTFGCPFEGKYDNPSAAVNFLKDYVDAGMKTCSVDNGTPVLKDHPELSSRMSEEHISHYMENQPYQVGDQVTYIPSHCCTTVNLHDHIYLVSGDEVVRVIEVKSRGKSQ